VHNLCFHGYWIFKNYSSELPVNVVYLCYLFKCGMWDKYPFIAEIILEAFLKVDSKLFSNPGLIYKITASRIIIFSRKDYVSIQLSAVRFFRLTPKIPI
jgi:hypothetical protein